MYQEYTILSEKPEDAIRAKAWAKDELDRLERSNRDGKELFEMFKPRLKELASKRKLVTKL